MLGYPGIFRGALLSGAREINVQMKLVAAHVIADLTEASTSLVPDVLDPNVHERVAEAVRDAAIESGVARLERMPAEGLASGRVDEAAVDGPTFGGGRRCAMGDRAREDDEACIVCRAPDSQRARPGAVHGGAQARSREIRDADRLSLEGCEEDARRYTKMDVGSEPDDDAADCCEGRRKGVYRWRTSSTS